MINELENWNWLVNRQWIRKKHYDSTAKLDVITLIRATGLITD